MKEQSLNGEINQMHFRAIKASQSVELKEGTG
jgi:hypothetical protein